MTDQLADFLAWLKLNEHMVECTPCGGTGKIVPSPDLIGPYPPEKHMECQGTGRVPHPMVKVSLRLIELGYVPDGGFIEAVKAVITGES